VVPVFYLLVAAEHTKEPVVEFEPAGELAIPK
jgi:hypothetical protein